VPPNATTPLLVSALQAPSFDIAKLIARAVAAEHDDQEDREEDDEAEDTHHDPLNDVDEEWPPPDPLDGVDNERPPLPATPPDPWDEVDDDNPHLVPAPKKRRRVSFDQAVAAHGGVPPVGPHRRRPAKPRKAEKALKAAEKAKKQRAAAHSRRKDQRTRQLGANGHVQSPATVAAYVQPAIPLTTDLDSTGLPTTLGAYSAKVVSKTERRGETAQHQMHVL
jgi:hypothetical protein